MIPFLRQSNFSKVLLYLFCVLYLNSIIDVSTSIIGTSENLLFNKQESIFELVVEKILGHNAFCAESNEDESSDNLENYNTHVVLFKVIKIHFTYITIFLDNMKKLSNVASFYCVHCDINVPPPKMDIV